MRLNPRQIDLIIETVSRLTSGTATVYLFGSRLDDEARGGDLDLLVESNGGISLVDRAQIKMELESLLGIPVDVVSKARGAEPTAFQQIVRKSAVKLEATS